MHEILSKIKVLNDSIFPLLEEKKWDDILQITNERDKYIKQYFSINPLPDSPEVISDVTTLILENDAKTSQMIKEDKANLINESISLQMNHKAIRQYQQSQL